MSQCQIEKDPIAISRFAPDRAGEYDVDEMIDAVIRKEVKI